MTKEMEYRLLSCKSVFEFLAMFFGLSMREKLSIFSEEVSVTKGTNLYRIRRATGIKNPDDPKEWGPVPQKMARQGRFNGKYESILYVASHPDTLDREVRLKSGEEFYLATYVCRKTFKVGSFLGVNNRVNTLLHKIAMSVSGPEELTEEENKIINQYYEEAKDKPLYELAVDMLVSLFMYKELPNLYNITNKLGKLVLSKNECGIRYSSVYEPIEYSGLPVMLTLDGPEHGNFALTPKGCENIEFISAKKKVCAGINGIEGLIAQFAKAEIDEKNNK